MNKFTKLIKESDSFEEIEDTLLDIYDILGKPRISTFDVGENPAYVLRWNLDFSISEYNGVDVLDKMSLLFNCISNIKSSQKRISGYDIEFKIGVYFFIRLIPHSKSKSDKYNFIERIFTRKFIDLSYTEIIKFFKDRGYSINVDYVHDIHFNHITISTKASQDIINEFITMFKSDLNEHIKKDNNKVISDYTDVYSDREGVISIMSSDVEYAQFFLKEIEN